MLGPTAGIRGLRLLILGIFVALIGRIPPNPDQPLTCVTMAAARRHHASQEEEVEAVLRA